MEKELKILSQGEFREFHAVEYMGQKPIYEVTYEGDSIKCTADHKFLTSEGWVEAQDLTKKHILNGKQVISVRNLEEIESVYDVIEVEGTNSFSVRGVEVHNCSFLYLDECAFIEGYDEFFASVYPTISSGESTKLLMTSTPNGLNHFYKTCVGAEEGTNGYRFVKVMWYDVPGRDERWRQETLEALDHDIEKFKQEYECVAGETTVTVRDKHTGEIKTLSISELYDSVGFLDT